MTKSLKRIPFNLTKDSIKQYDELLNISVEKQYTDTGFVDSDKIRVRPRPKFSFQDTPVSATGRASDMYFYTDKTGTTRAYRAVNTTANSTRSYQIQYATISSAGVVGAWVNMYAFPSTLVGENRKFNFMTVNAPIMNAGSPTFYTVGGVAATVDGVFKNAGDAAAATAIGSVMLISDQNYVGLYSNIDGYDAGTTTYNLQGSGALVAFTAGASYAILDRLGPVLRVATDEGELYFDGITYLSYLSNLATNSMRKSLILSSTEFIKKAVLYSNAYWTYKGGVLYRSGGFPGNPFFYPFTAGFTITDKEIRGVTVYRNRIIAYGKDFIYAYHNSGVIERLTDTIGVNGDAIFETGDDLWVVTTDKRVISINELASGTLFIRNITDKMSNYTVDFDEDCFIFSDNQNIYFGGNYRSSGDLKNWMYCLVYNLFYKLWHIYRMPACSGASIYQGKIYFTDRFLNAHRMIYTQQFTNETYTDLTESYVEARNVTSVATYADEDFTQRIAINWIDLGRFFEVNKEVQFINLALENVPVVNTLEVILSMWLDGQIATAPSKTFALTQLTGVSSLGTGVSGNELVGGTTNAIDTLVKRIKNVPYKTLGPVNAFKVTIQSVEDQGFFLDEFEVGVVVNTSQGEYVNPNSTN